MLTRSRRQFVVFVVVLAVPDVLLLGTHGLVCAGGGVAASPSFLICGDGATPKRTVENSRS